MANKLYRKLDVSDDELHLFSPPEPEDLNAPPTEDELKEPVKPQEKPFVTKEGLIKGAIESLPTGGALVGGVVGSPMGPLGTAGGAALGAGTGAAIKNALLQYMGESITPKESALDIAEQTALGGTGEAVAQPLMGAISKGAEAVSPYLKTGLKKSESAIRGAAERLGIKPTPAMLSESPVVQGLESSLEQSPSIPGAMIRSGTKPVREGLKAQSERVLEDATNASQFEVGEKVKSDVISRIHQESDPISAVYDQLTESLKEAPLKPKSIKEFSDKIQNLDVVKLTPDSPWSAKANQYARWIGNAQNVNDLKTIRTLVGKDREAAIIAKDTNSADVLSGIYDDITQLQERALKEAAIDLSAGSKEAGNQVFESLKEAGSKYKSLLTKIEDVSQKASLGKAKSVGQFVDRLEKVPSERIGEKLFNTQNYELLKVMSEEFPEEFQQLRQLRIAQIYKKSLSPSGEVSPRKLVSQIDKMTPEAVEMIFGGEKARIIQDIKTVGQSLPPMMGPSGTPQGLEFMNLIDPITQAKALGRYGIYQAAAMPGRASSLARYASEMSGLPASATLAGQAIKIPIEQVAEYSEMIKKSEPSTIERAKKLNALHKKGEVSVKFDKHEAVSQPVMQSTPMKTPQPNNFEDVADFAKRKKVQPY